MERAPAVAPVVGDVDRVRVREGSPPALLAGGVGVDRELDAVRALDLLEPVRKAREDPRACLLGPR
jgi:hypothetical protein